MGDGHGAWRLNCSARVNCLASRQRNVELQGDEKIRKMLRSRCLNGVATTNIKVMQKQKSLWPEITVTLSRQCCRVPSSADFYAARLVENSGACILPTSKWSEYC